MNLDDSVDDDLAVHDVDARVHDHRIADRNLCGGHRDPVCDARQQRNAERLHARLRAVGDLREESVGLEHETDDLQHRVECGA